MNLPEAIKSLVAKSVVERITAETTRDDGIGRFLVKLKQDEGDENSVYEVLHYVEK